MCTGRGRPEAKTSSARPRTSGSSAGSVTEWLKAVTFESRPCWSGRSWISPRPRRERGTTPEITSIGIESW